MIESGTHRGEEGPKRQVLTTRSKTTTPLVGQASNIHVSDLFDVPKNPTPRLRPSFLRNAGNAREYLEAQGT